MRKIRILLVDDENMAIRHFRKMMEGSSEAYEFAGEAANGMEALKKIEMLNPDIVFADVRMPVMDGLELAENVRKRFPSVKVILLSAYKDFAYIQQGLHIGVSGYLVKHEITRTQVDAIIRKVYQELNLEKVKERIYLEENLKTFLLSDSDKPEGNRVLGYEKYYFILLDVIVKQSLCLCGSYEKDSCFPVDQLEEQLNCGEVFCRASVKMSPSAYAVILFVKKGMSENTRRYGLQVILNTIQSLFRDNDLETVIIVSGILDKFSSLPAAYKKQRMYEPYVYGTPGKNVIFPEQEDHSRGDYRHMYQLKENLFVRNEQLEEAEKAMKQFFCIGRSVCSIEQYLSILNDIVLQIIQQGEYLEIKDTDEWKELRIGFFDSLEVLEQWILEIYGICIMEQIKMEQKHYSDKVSKALEYIKNAYASPITSEEICACLEISESHFRRIFREEVGMKPMEYLNSYRIEKAKKLLKDDHNKIQDVYERVGYSSSQYFSKVFKKLTGISPWQYQQEKGRERK